MAIIQPPQKIQQLLPHQVNMGGASGAHGLVGGGSSHNSPPKLLFTGGQ